MGEKPITRSGPWRLMVWMLAAATISLTSSQLERAKPPMPRTFWYSLRLASSLTMLVQASTGPMVWRAVRHRRSRRARTMGYFTRLALYRYQL